jgi:hypothetical protein
MCKAVGIRILATIFETCSKIIFLVYSDRIALSWLASPGDKFQQLFKNLLEARFLERLEQTKNFSQDSCATNRAN